MQAVMIVVLGIGGMTFGWFVYSKFILFLIPVIVRLKRSLFIDADILSLLIT